MTPPDAGPGRRFAVIAAVITAANFVCLTPSLLAFHLFTLGDAGWAINTDTLWHDEGLVPTRDFAYFYGLGALTIHRGWFAVFGRTPYSQALLEAVCIGLTAFAAVRIARAAKFGPVARLALLVAFPIAVMPIAPPSPVHSIEPAFLANALVLQASGRSRWALVVSVLCVFVKPSMAGLYSLLLVGVILFAKWGEPRPFRKRVIDLLPGTLTGIAAAAGLAALFGVEPLVKTLLPFDAAKLYGEEKYGFFFGVGRDFWFPGKWDWTTPFYYLLTPAGFWLVATAVFVVGGIRLARRGTGPAAFAIMSCLLMHLAFVFFLWGNHMSWFYYSFPLALGACGVINTVSAATPRGVRAAYGAVVVLSLTSQLAQLGYATLAWGQTVRPASCGGLFIAPENAASWEKIRAVTRYGKTVYLVRTGCTRELFPEIDSPRSWFLLRPVALPNEVERVRAQIRGAEFVVVPNDRSSSLFDWPEFRDELKAFRPAGSEAAFQLHQRARPVAAPAPRP